MKPPRRAVQFVREMFERRADPYQGADWNSTRRVAAAILALSALLSLAFLPLEPVDEEIGAAGWAVAGALILAGFAGAVAVVRRNPSFDELLAIAYLGVAGIATLNWLARGGSSAYEDLFVLWMAAGALHPPRRAVVHLGVLVLALGLPLAYQGTSSMVVGDMIAEALILIALGSIMITYLFYARRQRLGLQSGAEVARRLARVDTQTGLGNRRAFDEALTVEMSRTAFDGLPLSVGLVDIDGLRRVNDGWGHLEGDRCLREVAAVIAKTVRPSDACFRWGGDEFAVIMPSTDAAQAEAAVQRIAAAVPADVVPPGDEPVSLRYGIAEIQPGMDGEDLVGAADLALMSARWAG
jgi:diguanylate cyclase (GGDEF)-like protein